jgi:putative FmdB family regulatory protein
MPIYEYMCDSCSHRFEVKQKMIDPPVDVCDRCGKAVRRLISSPAIMFKGSGWYVTDYSDKMKAPAEGNGKAAEERADAKSDAKAANSDAKTDAKSETKTSEAKSEVKETKKDQTLGSSTPVPSKDSSSSGSSGSTPKT